MEPDQTPPNSQRSLLFRIGRALMWTCLAISVLAAIAAALPYLLTPYTRVSGYWAGGLALENPEILRELAAGKLDNDQIQGSRVHRLKSGKGSVLVRYLHHDPSPNFDDEMMELTTVWFPNTDIPPSGVFDLTQVEAFQTRGPLVWRSNRRSGRFRSGKLEIVRDDGEYQVRIAGTVYYEYVDYCSPRDCEPEFIDLEFEAEPIANERLLKRSEGWGR